MRKEIDLLRFQYTASILFLIGTLGYIKVTKDAIQVEELKQKGIDLSTKIDFSYTLYQLTMIFIIALFILSLTGIARLNNKEAQLKRKVRNKWDTERPERNVAVGFSVATLAYSLIALGAYENAAKASGKIAVF